MDMAKAAVERNVFGEGSCDRCHKGKAKCIYIPGQVACLRCAHLHHRCSTSRNRLKRGRKPQDEVLAADARARGFGLVWVVNGWVNQGDDASSSQEEQYHSLDQPSLQETASTTTVPPAELPLPEDSILSIMWSKNHLPSQIVMCQSFVGIVARSMETAFKADPGLLQETYLATAAAYVQIQNGRICNDEVNLNRTTIALKKLCCCLTVNHSHLVPFLTLSMSLVAFEMLTRHVSLHVIVQHTLLLLKPWYDFLWDDGVLQSHTQSLVIMDTISCLVHREVPVMECLIKDKTYVDRNLGLCSALQPIFYHLCRISHHEKMHSRDQSIEVTTAYDDIESEIRDWKPVLTPETYEKYTQEEMCLMLSHTRIYPQTLRLYIHRLKYPYGVNDELGLSMAKEIFSELEYCFKIAGRYPFSSWFPIFVASIEFHGSEDRPKVSEALKLVFKAIFTQIIMRLKNAIEVAWNARALKSVVTWEEVVESIPKMGWLP